MLAAADVNEKGGPRSLSVGVTQGKAPDFTQWLRSRIFT